jgi:predicted GNAT family N-acyltransferase
LDELPRVRLGRLVVAAAHRRRGIASALLAEAGQVARAEGATTIVLHAQTYACPLYAAAGYRSRGEPFMEAGIEHVAMERELA